jgi:hypothetical protein
MRAERLGAEDADLCPEGYESEAGRLHNVDPLPFAIGQAAHLCHEGAGNVGC